MTTQTYKLREPRMVKDCDETQAFFGAGLYINDAIQIHQPTVGEIVDFGEAEYYGMLSSFTAVPSDMIGQLHKAGIRWMDIDDFELFIMLSRSLSVEATQILFGEDIDFTKFELFLNKQNQMVFLEDPNGVRIDVNIYTKMAEYIRMMHGIKPKRVRAFNKTTEKVMVQEALAILEREKNKPHKSMMRSMVSSMVCSPGYKYDLEGTRGLGIVAFMDFVKRVGVIKSADQLIMGAYAGNVDVSKINKKELDWMRDLD